MSVSLGWLGNDMCEGCDAKPGGLTRRQVLATGLGATFAAAMPFEAFAENDNGISPADAWQRLVEGNERYINGAPLPADYAAGRVDRALTQRPFAAILSCADSRVAPELTFDQGPGDLFVVRVAGNFVETDGLASLEYAINFLGTRLIVVLGHSNCGAVDAAIKVVRDKIELPGHLPGMLAPILPAAEDALAAPGDDLLRTAIAGNVRRGVGALNLAGPIIGPAVASGQVLVVGAVYDIATGRISEV